MLITFGEVLQTDRFQEYVESLRDPNAFLESLDWELNERKINRFKKVLPDDFSVDQLVSSLLLNLQQDYDAIITDLPPGFHARETRERTVHVGNTNQIGIHYEGEIKKGEDKSDTRIACVSFHFRDIGGGHFMYLENVQGELKEGHYSRREIRRIFGKLNSHFGEDWRIGLLRQPLKYARDQGMEVKGNVPGVFYFIRDSLIEHPIYALNYVQTYLRLGLPLEDITFNPTPKEIQARWDRAISFLETETPEERLRLLSLAAREYTKTYDRLHHQWLEEEDINYPMFEAGCKKEFARVFTKYLYQHPSK